MKPKPHSPIWPYLGILACLFVLSVTAPRAWDRMARQETPSNLLAERKPRETAIPEWPVANDRLDVAQQPTTEQPVGVPTAADPSIEIEPPVSVVEPPRPSWTIVPPAPEYAQQVRPPGDEAEAEVEAAPADEDPDESAANDVLPAEVPSGAEVASTTWPRPRVLLKQLQELVEADPSATWAQQAIELVNELCRKIDQQGRTPGVIVAELRAVLPGESSSARTSGPVAGQEIRARYALTRWLDIWEPATRLDETRTANATRAGSTDQIAACLPAVESLMQQDTAGVAWREYLQLDALERLAGNPDSTPDECRRVARRVLDRLASADLTRAQRRFINDGPVAELRDALRRWAAEPVGSTRLLAHLDAYERTGLPSDAQLLANDWRGLSWQDVSAAEEISRHIATHYRNANVRLVLASELLNRWIPQPEAVESRVRDTIVNVPVYGRNTTFTKLSVRLVPDPQRIRLGLEASGIVASNTVSSSGPARLYNQGQSTFLVRKLLVLGPDGLAMWPAVAEAENDFNYLVSMETGFDGVPLVGSLVRNIARSQHDELQSEARFEVEQKVAIRARDQFDAEASPRIVKAAESIQENQVATLHRLGLELVPVGLSTSEERVVARVRLAGKEQLGAHTPRPRAPSDCWASVQIHQSALNNGLESLDLNGRTFTIEELFAWVADKLNRPDLAEQEDLPENVQMTFADKDAVRLNCEDGRVEVMFSFAELKQGSKRWHDFTVRSFYQPERQGLTPRFVRDRGTIFLEGKSLRGKPQFTLRAIFSRVLSLNRDLNLVDEKITTDPRVQDLEISQFLVEHGWIGLAYSPRRPAANVARQPK